MGHGTAGGAGLSVCMRILTHSGTSHPHIVLLEGLSRHSQKSDGRQPVVPAPQAVCQALVL